MISILQFPCRLIGLFLLCHLARLSLAANTADWRSRSIYQVFTDRFARTDGSTSAKCDTEKGLFCGGTWRGIINKLDYIQDLGFDAIMISPVSKNLEGRVIYGEAYHGYWVTDLYQLNHHFGSREDLLDLGKQLHDRGMYLMVDVVINNMAAMTNGSNPATSVDYSVFSPFNDKKYFHPYCKIEDYDDYRQAQMCWTGDDIVALPDLKTESEDVTRMMEAWVKGLVANYSIDGLRIDAAKHTGTAYLERVAKASGVFVTGEVFEGNVKIACDYQNYIPSVPNYPVYFSMIKAFTAGNISALTNELADAKGTCKDINTLATFSENHDLPRFPSYTKDLSVSACTTLYNRPFTCPPTLPSNMNFTNPDTPARQKRLNLHNPIRRDPALLPGTRATLLRRRHSHQPRSPLDLKLQHQLPTLPTNSKPQQDPRPRHPHQCRLRPGPILPHLHRRQHHRYPQGCRGQARHGRLLQPGRERGRLPPRPTHFIHAWNDRHGSAGL